MFINLNIYTKIVKVDVVLNMMFYNDFNDNRNNYKLLNMFQSVVNDSNKRIRFRMREIEEINNDVKKSNYNII